jgi:hypothetical protein
LPHDPAIRVTPADYSSTEIAWQLNAAIKIPVPCRKAEAGRWVRRRSARLRSVENTLIASGLRQFQKEHRMNILIMK